MAVLRAAIFPLFAKNRRGGHFCPPPPSSARVKVTDDLNLMLFFHLSRSECPMVSRFEIDKTGRHVA